MEQVLFNLRSTTLLIIYGRRDVVKSRAHKSFMCAEMSSSRRRINHLYPLGCRRVASETAPIFISSDCTVPLRLLLGRRLQAVGPAPSRPRLRREAILPLGSLATSRLYAHPPGVSALGLVRAEAWIVGKCITSFCGPVGGGKWTVLSVLPTPSP